MLSTGKLVLTTPAGFAARRAVAPVAIPAGSGQLPVITTADSRPLMLGTGRLGHAARATCRTVDSDQREHEERSMQLQSPTRTPLSACQECSTGATGDRVCCTASS
jgi:hypothetical protein